MFTAFKVSEFKGYALTCRVRPASPKEPLAAPARGFFVLWPGSHSPVWIVKVSFLLRKTMFEKVEMG